LFALGTVVIIAASMWILMRRFHRSWLLAKEGTAILGTRRLYATQVLAVQIASYLLRIAVTAVFMLAYDVPVSPRTVLLVVAVNAFSSTFAVTPGGVGSQQALASVALRNYAPSNVIAAYSLGQQVIISAWDLTLGLLLLWWAIGWKATREAMDRDTGGVPVGAPARTAQNRAHT
jgi:uncharacterized membrane protein YbhN (UPF0104 family)